MLQGGAIAFRWMATQRVNAAVLGQVPASFWLGPKGGGRWYARLNKCTRMQRYALECTTPSPKSGRLRTGPQALDWAFEVHQIQETQCCTHIEGSTSLAPRAPIRKLFVCNFVLKLNAFNGTPFKYLEAKGFELDPRRVFWDRPFAEMVSPAAVVGARTSPTGLGEGEGGAR